LIQGFVCIILESRRKKPFPMATSAGSGYLTAPGERDGLIIGLICMGARYLDPRTGRFIQPDPVGLVDPATGKVNQEMLLNPQRLNRYVYALNNPYRYVDPEGMSAKHRPGREYQDILEGGGFRSGGGPSGSFLKGNGSIKKGLGLNPFKGKSFKEIDRIFTDRGFKKTGSDPASGKGSYFNKKTGRKYYLDRGRGGYKKGMRENSHVDVHRMKNGENIETEKRKYPLGDRLYEYKK
jgi:RHS repeat-associated protein